LPPPDVDFPQQCSWKARFVVASKEAGLGLEERNVQLRALVSVSGGALRLFGGPVDVVRSRLGQWCDMV